MVRLLLRQRRSKSLTELRFFAPGPLLFSSYLHPKDRRKLLRRALPPSIGQLDLLVASFQITTFSPDVDEKTSNCVEAFVKEAGEGMAASRSVRRV